MQASIVTEGAIGPYLILTRPERQSRRFAAQVRAAGLRTPILFSPVLEIELWRPDGPVPMGMRIFTSENGVRAAAALGLLEPGAPALAVGERTARAARAAGLDCRAADGNVAGIVALIARKGIAGPFVHLHGRHVTGDLSAALRGAGHVAAARVVYDQVPRRLSDAARAALARRDVVLPLFSPRTAALVAGDLPARPARTRVVALSAAVARAWPWGDPLRVAAEPSAEALLEELRRLVATGPER